MGKETIRGMTRQEIQAQCQESSKLVYAGRGAEANAMMERLAKRYPRDTEVLFYRGFLLVRSGDAKAGIPFLKRAATALPDQPEIQMELALAHDEAGEEAKAGRLMEKIVARWPEVADAWIHLGNRAAMAGDHKTAAGHYEAALMAEPGHVGALLIGASGGEGQLHSLQGPGGAHPPAVDVVV